MKKVFDFPVVEPWPAVSNQDWQDWKWQFRNALKTKAQFSQFLNLSSNEIQGFEGADKVFRVQTTPYYLSSMNLQNSNDPIRKMTLPSIEELSRGGQQMLDPLGENQESNRACERLVHRYSDRVLFLLTDLCSVYCRYCTRKHFTASDQVVATKKQIDEAVTYVKKNSSIKEVIFSGGDPLTVSNSILSQVIEKFYDIPHVELIRMGTRMPVVAPMRIDDELISIFKKFKPIYLMTHFNHPQEITRSSAEALEKLVDNGVPVFNQMVLLNGINNHEAIVYALSRRLLWLRVKPYYMFQADPSVGTDHLRTSIDDSLKIQKNMWGHASGLAMPNYVVDIPGGGGKAPMVPNFQTQHEGDDRTFEGWDGIEANYKSPQEENIIQPAIDDQYKDEWLTMSSKG